MNNKSSLPEWADPHGPGKSSLPSHANPHGPDPRTLGETVTSEWKRRYYDTLSDSDFRAMHLGTFPPGPPTVVKKPVGSHPKLGLLGHSGCGKDEAGLYMARTHGLRFQHSLSWYLAPLVHEAYPYIPLDVLRGPGRHAHKELMFRVGQQARAKDPGVLIRLATEENDVISGFRDVDELDRARETGVLDLVCWIDRDVEPDPTMREFGDKPWRHADITIDNTGSIPELHSRLATLLRALGIPLLGLCPGGRTC